MKKFLKSDSGKFAIGVATVFVGGIVLNLWGGQATQTARNVFRIGG